MPHAVLETFRPPFTSLVESDKPFEPEEEKLMQTLINADIAFKQLPDQKKTAVSDWDINMRNLQRILSMRVMRRLFPDAKASQSDE